MTTADALASTLDETWQALAEGDISFAHAAAVAHGTRRQPDHQQAEQQLLRTARQGEARQVAQQARRTAMLSAPEEGNWQARRQYDSRGMITGRTRDGMVFREGQLHQLAGERLLAALSWDARPAGHDDPRTLRSATPTRCPAGSTPRWTARACRGAGTGGAPRSSRWSPSRRSSGGRRPARHPDVDRPAPATTTAGSTPPPASHDPPPHDPPDLAYEHRPDYHNRPPPLRGSRTPIRPDDHPAGWQAGTSCRRLARSERWEEQRAAPGHPPRGPRRATAQTYGRERRSTARLEPSPSRLA
ncbi:MAG TPA: DUF222 domain-containing protein [Nitriliruptorales bacterium]|nr:DUF222 domain-containing protein [Nitriliruptorales bacterium]